MESIISLKDVDVNYDFTFDTPNYYDNYWKNEMGSGNDDPDTYSKKLKTYHKLIWSKKLPNGEYLNLDYGKNGKYLIWKDFSFGSDSITASFRYANNTQFMHKVIETIPNYKEFILDYVHRSYTIGGLIIFPKRSLGVNPARGINKYICDRFDLTLECIRKYYLNEESPLYSVLIKDKEFFDLFVNFKGYIDYFFLNDLVTEDYKEVKFIIGNGDFEKNPMPKTVEDYIKYINGQLEFVKLRNGRIKEYIKNIK